LRRSKLSLFTRSLPYASSPPQPIFSARSRKFLVSKNYKVAAAFIKLAESLLAVTENKFMAETKGKAERKRKLLISRRFGGILGAHYKKRIDLVVFGFAQKKQVVLTVDEGPLCLSLPAAPPAAALPERAVQGLKVSAYSSAAPV
jgi:hypothetical protein